MVLIEQELSQRVLACAFAVHTELGPGLLESAYEECLSIELDTAGLNFQRQLMFPVMYKGKKTEKSFRVDLLVERKIVLELKSVAVMPPIFDAVVINYLRLLNCPVGYLINFHVMRLKDGIKRFVN